MTFCAIAHCPRRTSDSGPSSFSSRADRTAALFGEEIGVQSGSGECLHGRRGTERSCTFQIMDSPPGSTETERSSLGETGGELRAIVGAPRHTVNRLFRGGSQGGGGSALLLVFGYFAEIWISPAVCRKIDKSAFFLTVRTCFIRLCRMVFIAAQSALPVTHNVSSSDKCGSAICWSG